MYARACLCGKAVDGLGCVVGWGGESGVGRSQDEETSVHLVGEARERDYFCTQQIFAREDRCQFVPACAVQRKYNIQVVLQVCTCTKMRSVFSANICWV